jgi:hypothetical protein
MVLPASSIEPDIKTTFRGAKRLSMKHGYAGNLRDQRRRSMKTRRRSLRRRVYLITDAAVRDTHPSAADLHFAPVRLMHGYCLSRLPAAAGEIGLKAKGK